MFIFIRARAIIILILISGYNESLISKIHYNQIKEGYNEREKYKTQSKLYYFKT